MKLARLGIRHHNCEHGDRGCLAFVHGIVRIDSVKRFPSELLPLQERDLFQILLAEVRDGTRVEGSLPGGAHELGLSTPYSVRCEVKVR